MKHFCRIRHLSENTNTQTVIQGKVINKSEMLVTKHGSSYFWCIIQDEQNKFEPGAKEPNEIKIMFWHPYSKRFYAQIKERKIYDFKNMKLKKPKRRYHSHSHQLTVTQNTTIKEKQQLLVLKNGFLCNQKNKEEDSQLQINIQHYFKPS